MFKVEVRGWDSQGQQVNIVPPSQWPGTIEEYLHGLGGENTWIGSTHLLINGRNGRTVYELQPKPNLPHCRPAMLIFQQ